MGFKPVTASSLHAAMRGQARAAEPWREGKFALVRRLQQSHRNYGHVDVLRCIDRQDQLAAVKSMPDWWVCDGPDEFLETHQDQEENPWFELGMLAELERRSFPYSCRLWGAFHDDSTFHLVTEFASEGDLFDWSWRRSKLAAPGQPAGEGEMRPIVAQIFHAVQLLHELGVAHRDLSLENVALTSVGPLVQGMPFARVRLLDFCQSHIGRMAPVLGQGRFMGKQPYAAPEQYRSSGWYDAFLADAFSLGVMIFCLAFADYPWQTTRPGSLPLEQAHKVGMRAHLDSCVVRGRRVQDTLSPEMLDLMSGLLQIDTTQRFSLGEGCFQRDRRMSVWSSSWWLDGPSPVASTRSASTIVSESDIFAMTGV